MVPMICRFFRTNRAGSAPAVVVPAGAEICHISDEEREMREGNTHATQYT
jgi:hypothetical protein